MGARNYTVREVCFRHEQGCNNEARATDADGDRICGLCGDGILSLRDVDIPDLLKLLDVLLTDIDKQMYPVATLERQSLRNIIGRNK